MAGPLYVKHIFAPSDEALVHWVENPHWQAFRGEEYFQHEPPIHRTNSTRYRKRLGLTGCEELLRPPPLRRGDCPMCDPGTGPD